MTNGSSMKVESTAECFLQYFDLHYTIIGLENLFSVFLGVAVLHRFYCTCISDKAHNLRGRRWVEPASEDQVNAIPEVPAGWDGEYGNLVIVLKFLTLFTFSSQRQCGLSGLKFTKYLSE